MISQTRRLPNNLDLDNIFQYIHVQSFDLTQDFSQLLSTLLLWITNKVTADNTVKIGGVKKRRKYDFPSVGGGSRLWPSTRLLHDSWNVEGCLEKSLLISNLGRDGSSAAAPI